MHLRLASSKQLDEVLYLADASVMLSSGKVVNGGLAACFLPSLVELVRSISNVAAFEQLGALANLPSR